MANFHDKHRLDTRQPLFTLSLPLRAYYSHFTADDDAENVDMGENSSVMIAFLFPSISFWIQMFTVRQNEELSTFALICSWRDGVVCCCLKLMVIQIIGCSAVSVFVYKFIVHQRGKALAFVKWVLCHIMFYFSVMHFSEESCCYFPHNFVLLCHYFHFVSSGYAFVIPYVMLFPFYIIQLFDIRNRFLRMNLCFTPLLVVFRCLEGGYNRLHHEVA